MLKAHVSESFWQCLSGKRKASREDDVKFVVLENWAFITFIWKIVGSTFSYKTSLELGNVAAPTVSSTDSFTSHNWQ